MKIMGEETRRVVVGFTCDRCKIVHEDEFETQEFLSWEDRCGYGNNTFGDLTTIAIDLCQYCVKEVLGPWIRVTDWSTRPTEDEDEAAEENDGGGHLLMSDADLIAALQATQPPPKVP